MTTFPNSPRLIKGALVGMDLFNPLASVVVFQYNPDTVTRTVSAQASGDNPDRGEALRLKGPPQETIKLEVEIDAADVEQSGDGFQMIRGSPGGNVTFTAPVPMAISEELRRVSMPIEIACAVARELKAIVRQGDRDQERLKRYEAST